MKMRYLIPGVLMIAVLGLVPLSDAHATSQKTTIQDVQQETQDLLKTLKGYGVAQRDEAIRDTKEALERVDNRIDALEARVDNKWDQMNAAARETARENLRALRKQRNQMAEWYGGLKNSSDSAWDHVKQGISKAYQDLSKAWEKAEQEFNDGK